MVVRDDGDEWKREPSEISVVRSFVKTEFTREGIGPGYS